MMQTKVVNFRPSDLREGRSYSVNDTNLRLSDLSFRRSTTEL